MAKTIKTTYTDEEFRQLIREEATAAFQDAINNMPGMPKVERQDRDFMNTVDAATFLNMKVGSLYNMVHQRTIPFNKAGRSVRFNKAALVEWMKREKEQ